MAIMANDQGTKGEDNKDVHISDGHTTPSHAAPKLTLSPRWIHEGPWPAGMREQPFGPDPRFLNEIDSTTYTADSPAARLLPPENVHALAEEDKVQHKVSLSYPEVDWEAHRRTAGWSALQWQGMLVTQLDVPQDSSNTATSATKTLEVSVEGAIEFAIVPLADKNANVFRWHTADYYSYNTSPFDDRTAVPHFLHLPTGRYWLIIKALYEVRVFGGFPPDDIPAVNVTVRVALLPHGEALRPFAIVKRPLLQVPDIIQGHIAGTHIVVGLSNPHPTHSWNMESVRIGADLASLVDCHLDTPCLSVSPSQTIRLPLRITLKNPSMIIPKRVTAAKFDLLLASDNSDELLSVRVCVPLRHLPLPTPGRHYAYNHVYGSPAHGGPYSAVVIPALRLRHSKDDPPVIVALHGAGVDIEASPWWSQAFPRHDTSWIVMPTGLTPWGLDWQQSSYSSWLELVKDRSYTEVILGLLSKRDGGRPPAMPSQPPKIILVGHSNGGQGAWHGMVHGGDRIIGGIVGAGYIKLEEYVDINWRDLRHTTDPALIAILDSSRSVFANDLHSSNLAGMPILIKYGAEDDNVPPWHSRAMATLLKQWNAIGNVPQERWPRLVEVPGEGHWWDTIFHEEDVQEELSLMAPYAAPDKLTLVCVIPHITQARFGLQVLETEIPGRIAKVEVEFIPNLLESATPMIQVRTRNVTQLTLDAKTLASAQTSEHNAHASLNVIRLDGISFAPTLSSVSRNGICQFVRQGSSKHWTLADSPGSANKHQPPRLLSPISLLLDQGPMFLLIQPSTSTASRREAFRSISIRWAQSLMLYTGLRAVPIEADVIAREELLRFSCIFMGGPEENVALRQLQEASRVAGQPAEQGISIASTPLCTPDTATVLDWEIPFIRHLGAGQFSICDEVFADASTALLYAIPRPRGDQDFRCRALVLTGTDESGIERAGRLLPIRTGTPVPEWIVVGAKADRFGGGGVLAAGWYGRQWDFSPAMSYLP